MSDPIVVEVVCPHGSYQGREKVFIPCEENCEVCDGSQWFYGFLSPGSIAELEIRLGRAAEAYFSVRRRWIEEPSRMNDAAVMGASKAMNRALAALRKAREADSGK